MISGPDDVSMRTTDYYGSAMAHAHEVWGYWVSLVLDLQSLVNVPDDDALCLAAILFGDELQASAYAALTGFYRQALSGLRSGLEAIVAGAYFRSSPDPTKFARWADGDKEGQLWMKDVRKELGIIEPYSRFEAGSGLETLMPKNGWIEFLYTRLSGFTHGRPYFVDDQGNQIPSCNLHLWGGSNGPIYEPRSVRMWSVYYMDVLLCCLLLTGLAEPRLLKLRKSTDLSYREFVERLVKWHGLHPVARTIIDHLLN